MTRKSLTYFVFLIAMVGTIRSAMAETIYLKDGTFFEGNVIHYYENTLHVVLASGDSLILNRSELDKISFSGAVPAADAKPTEKSATTTVAAKGKNDSAKKSVFASPKQTFEVWKRALTKGDFEAMAGCFIESAQPLMLQKLREIPDEQRSQMVNDANKTDYKLSRPKIDGDRATMNVTRLLNKNSQVEELNFVRENGDWKLVPN